MHIKDENKRQTQVKLLDLKFLRGYLLIDDIKKYAKIRE